MGKPKVPGVIIPQVEALMVSALPCPFCLQKKLRVDVQHHDGMDVCSITCGKCFADGPATSTPERAVELWNKREIPPHVKEAFEELTARREGTWTGKS